MGSGRPIGLVSTSSCLGSSLCAVCSSCRFVLVIAFIRPGSHSWENQIPKQKYLSWKEKVWLWNLKLWLVLHFHFHFCWLWQWCQISESSKNLTHRVPFQLVGSVRHVVVRWSDCGQSLRPKCNRICALLYLYLTHNVTWKKCNRICAPLYLTHKVRSKISLILTK